MKDYYNKEYEVLDISVEKQHYLLKRHKRLLEALYSFLKEEKVCRHHLDELVGLYVLKKKVDPHRNQQFFASPSVTPVDGCGSNGQITDTFNANLLQAEVLKQKQHQVFLMEEEKRRKNMKKVRMQRRIERLKLFFIRW